MTEAQRNYLADLAGRKGTRLFDTDNWSVAKASAEIERLKSLPDAVFSEVSDDENTRIEKLTGNVLGELAKWGFVRRAS